MERSAATPREKFILKKLALVAALAAVLITAVAALAVGGNPLITFSNDGPGATATCQTDAGTPVDCSGGSYSPTGLAPGNHTVTVVSAFAVPTAAGPPTNTAAPAISGTPREGDTLTAEPAGWTGSPTPTLTYAWSDGATGATDKLTSADVGTNITVTVTATNSAGTADATCAAGGPVTASPSRNGPTNTSAPSISGIPMVAASGIPNAGTLTAGGGMDQAERVVREERVGAACEREVMLHTALGSFASRPVIA